MKKLILISFLLLSVRLFGQIEEIIYKETITENYGIVEISNDVVYDLYDDSVYVIRDTLTITTDSIPELYAVASGTPDSLRWYSYDFDGEFATGTNDTTLFTPSENDIALGIGYLGINAYWTNGTDADSLVLEICDCEGDAEMISNGTFTTSDYWTIISNWAITTGSPGYIAFDDVASGIFGQTPSDMSTVTTTQVSYTVTFTVSELTEGILALIIGDYNYSTSWASGSYANGDHSEEFTIASDDLGNGGIGFRASASGSGSACRITNISLQLTE